MENQMDEVEAQPAVLIMADRDGGYSKGHETREMILHTALHILIEEGYRAMSMRRVAVDCGIKFGNLTYHYRTREDLVRELLEAVIRSYEVEFDQIIHLPGTPAERLQHICRFILEDIRSKKTTHLFPELWALSNHDAFVLGRVQDLYDRARAPLSEIVGEMRPDLPGGDRKAIALFISASIEGMTPFAGFEKPFEPLMPKLEEIALYSFVTLVETYGKTG
ncbi:TetR/AcrR family transcriptional regulator [Sphingobium sp. Leaf26]|uniref:TetR/AcrR family transcriptional regulator n=1 Tax=Sphingobium sp. Leaf26 TaxID=1735693 RepID=UPI000A9B46AC|nr:TetR/AcrR family transcriptional regulator [Sphingobium sp. Leaf26]